MAKVSFFAPTSDPEIYDDFNLPNSILLANERKYF